MTNAMVETPDAGVVRTLPAVPNRANLTLRDVADAYMAAYRGRDATRPGAVAFWKRELGGRRIVDIDADAIADVLDRLAATPVTKYAGKDPDTGEPILRKFGKRAPATINRQRSIISGLLTFAQRRRMVARDWANPCRQIAAERVDNQRTRFLTPEERERLLRTCRLSTWPRLYLLVLMALTTGARRGELLRLRYRDLDLQRGTAHLRQTKNGAERVLPLVAAVVAEIKRFGKGEPDALLFGSSRRQGRPMVFGKLFEAALLDARIEDCRFHDLRHSCASYLAQNGATLLEIADVLGHKTLDMVRRYAHLTTGHKAALINRVLGDVA